MVGVVEALAAISVAMAAHGQRPVPRTETTTDLEGISIEGLRVGGMVGPLAVTGEALNTTDMGFGVQIFVGLRTRPLDEIRFGVSWNWVPGNLPTFLPGRLPLPTFDPDVIIYTAYLEAYWAHDLSSAVTLRWGPRLFGARLTGDRYNLLFFQNALNGIGAGVIGGALYSLSERISLESTIALSGGWFTYSGTGAAGWFWEFRAGAMYELTH